MASILGGLVVIATTWTLAATDLNPFKTITSHIPKLMVDIERLEPCPEYPDTPVEFQNLVIHQIGFNKFVVKGEIIIKETLQNPRIELEMHRCSSKDDPGSCEYYFTYHERNVCKLLSNQDKTWDYFTNGTDLPKECPFPAKSYTIDGSMIDLKELKTVPFFKSRWMLKNKAFQNDKLMFCVISEFSLQTTTKSKFIGSDII